MPAAVCKVRCEQCGDVIVTAGDVVIDDAEGCYRFTCPRHRGGVERPLGDDLRALLRSVNVPTLEELVDSFAALLVDDMNIVRGLKLLDP